MCSVRCYSVQCGDSVQCEVWKAFVKHEAAEQEDVDQQDVVEQKADSKPYYQPSVGQHCILLVTAFLLGCLCQCVV